MLKGVIFDWDGVLADSLQIHHNFFQHLCKKTGRVYPFRSVVEMRKNWKEPFPDFYEQLGFNWAQDSPFLGEEFESFMTKNHIPFKGGMKELLEEFSLRFRIGIASSNRSIVIRAGINAHNIERFVHEIVTGSEVARHKPHPDVLLHCAEKMKLLTSAVVYIGDQPTDIIAAQRADMKSIAVTWGWADHEKLEHVRPDFMVTTPAELKRVIESLS